MKAREWKKHKPQCRENHIQTPSLSLHDQWQVHPIPLSLDMLIRESIPSRLVRSPGSPRRRKGVGALEVEIGVWNSQGGGKDKHLFSLYIP